MSVLVTAASRHGATAEIAQRIGADLAARGVEVDVKRLDEVDDLASYDAVVVGSAVYLGKWMKEAIAFVERHANELSERQTWLFASGSIVGDPPLGNDPNAVRQSLVDKLVTMTGAHEHKVFAGKLDQSKLSFAEKVPARMAGGRDGDWRDWDAVDEWAADIASHATLSSRRQREGGVSGHVRAVHR